MKRSPRIQSSAFLLIFSLAILSGSMARAQAAADPQSPGPQPALPGASQGSAQAALVASQGEAKAAKEAGKEENTSVYRHSAAVQMFARALHLPVERAARLFEFLNFGILALSIFYFVIKLLPQAFHNRKAAIQRQLAEARITTEVANERLNGVERRLSHLDHEIDAIRKQVEHDAVQDEARIKAALEEERLRIVESAGHEIEAAGAAAQRELKRFAAELAVDRAISQLSLTPETDRKLIESFAHGLGNEKDGGRN